MAPTIDAILTAIVASFAALVLFSILPAPRKRRSREDDEWAWYLRSKGR